MKSKSTEIIQKMFFNYSVIKLESNNKDIWEIHSVKIKQVTANRQRVKEEIIRSTSKYS